MKINKSQLAGLPKICPCQFVRDEYGYHHLYFINVDPKVIHAMMDFFNYSSSGVYIESSSPYLFSILNLDNVDRLDWNQNKFTLMFFLLCGNLVKSDHLINKIKENILDRSLKRIDEETREYLVKTLHSLNVDSIYIRYLDLENYVSQQ